MNNNKPNTATRSQFGMKKGFELPPSLVKPPIPKVKPPKKDESKNKK